MAQPRKAVRTSHTGAAVELPSAPAVLDEAQLRAYGEAFGAQLRAPVVVALHGPLGAGKTTLAQAIARGAGVRGDVTSPTFALVHEYAANETQVYHVDLFRLDSEDQLTNLGWDDIVAANAIVLIEWPERAGTRLPAPRIDVTLREHPGRDDVRMLSVARSA